MRVLVVLMQQTIEVRRFHIDVDPLNLPVVLVLVQFVWGVLIRHHAIYLLIWHFWIWVKHPLQIGKGFEELWIFLQLFLNEFTCG